MFVYSTCRDCGGLLHVTFGKTGGHQQVHPACVPKQTKLERLSWEWLEAVLADNSQRETDLYTQIKELDDRPPRLLDAAVRYTQWGWPVFPLKPHSKQPATKHGFKDATTDPERITAWWTAHPDHNIGLPTGHAFDVIDIDVPHGMRLLPSLIDDDKIPDVHGQVATASGGMHLYVPPSGDGNRAGVYPGIDYRGKGGYVVAPPSTLGERGRAWSWTTAPSPVLTAVKT